jgi:hypothetical protein
MFGLSVFAGGAHRAIRTQLYFITDAVVAQPVGFWKSRHFFGFWAAKGRLNQRNAAKAQRRKDFGC